jgi:hypothetical protein
MPDASNTKITIINRALSHLKQRNITSLTEASEQARKALQFYDQVRKTCLRSCDWRFARVQVALTLLGDINTALENPTDLSKQDVVDQFNYLYAYPADCVRLVKVYNQLYSIFPEPYGDRHVASGAYAKHEIMRSPISKIMAIACNLELAKCHYTMNVTDESQFDDMFNDAMAWALADDLCMPLTADKELQQIVHKESEGYMQEAQRKSGGESTETQPRVSPYEDAREGGGDFSNHSL